MKQPAERKRGKKRGQNEGSIYRHADGRWRAIVPARQSPSGKRHVIYGSERQGTNSREAVARKLHEYLAGKPGNVLVPSRDTLESFLQRWLSTVASRVKPRTLESYDYAVKKLIIPSIGGMKLQSLEPQHVAAMMSRLTTVQLTRSASDGSSRIVLDALRKGGDAKADQLAQLARVKVETMRNLLSSLKTRGLVTNPTRGLWRAVVQDPVRLLADGSARQKGRTRSLRSVAYARSVLRIALTDAKRWGVVARNVADREYVDPPRIPKSEIEPLDAATAALLLRTIKGMPSEALITTMLTLGMRIGEALGLRWRDVDFDAKTIRIVRAYQRQGKEHTFVEVKTDRSRRLLLLPANLVDVLRDHKRRQAEQRMRCGDRWQDFGLVFASALGTPINPRNALRSLHAALAKASIPRKRLHDLRHTAATLLLTNRVPLDVVSNVLGHSSIRVTADVYSHFVLTRQEDVAAVMGDLIESGKAGKQGT